VGRQETTKINLQNFPLFWISSKIVGNAGGTREETLIYRVKLDREEIVAEAEGAVSGYVLNQFSMDEYNGFFRIVTTK
jgi:inhibitor of cysteine peptidase